MAPLPLYIFFYSFLFALFITFAYVTLPIHTHTHTHTSNTISLLCFCIIIILLFSPSSKYLPIYSLLSIYLSFCLNWTQIAEQKRENHKKSGTHRESGHCVCSSLEKFSCCFWGSFFAFRLKYMSFFWKSKALLLTDLVFFSVFLAVR